MAKSVIVYSTPTCPYCKMAKAFLDENPKPTEEQIREAIDGNICRCTGYNSILRAMAAVVNGEYKEER